MIRPSGSSSYGGKERELFKRKGFSMGAAGENSINKWTKRSEINTKRFLGDGILGARFGLMVRKSLSNRHVSVRQVLMQVQGNMQGKIFGKHRGKGGGKSKRGIKSFQFFPSSANPERVRPK